MATAEDFMKLPYVVHRRLRDIKTKKEIQMLAYWPCEKGIYITCFKQYDDGHMDVRWYYPEELEIID